MANPENPEFLDEFNDSNLFPQNSNEPLFDINSNFSNKFTLEEQDNFIFWKKQADEGDAQSQAQTGLNYKNGDGVECSYEKAYYYYKLASDQCHSGAHVGLGDLYEHGRGVEQSYENAFHYYQLAADSGSGVGYFNLGVFYAEGKWVEKSIAKAIEHYQMAAKQGNTLAFSYLKEAYERGIEVEHSKENDPFNKEIFHDYKENADEGDAESQRLVASAFENGIGVESSFESAFYYYKLAADQGCIKAILELAECFSEGKGVEKSRDNALYYYKLAAEKGSQRAKYSLLINLIENDNYDEVINTYKSLIQSGQTLPSVLAHSQYILGEYLENGKSIKKSKEDAIYYYTLAAEGGYLEAQCKLGRAYYFGDLGLSCSYDEAFYYFEKAGKQGSSYSLEMLGNFYRSGKVVEASEEKSFYYYKKAAEIDIANGKGSSILPLAECYHSGIGTEKSIETAIYYYKLAGDNGAVYGYEAAAYCYKKMGGEENEKKAEFYFKMAKKEHGNNRKSIPIESSKINEETINKQKNISNLPLVNESSTSKMSFFQLMRSSQEETPIPKKTISCVDETYKYISCEITDYFPYIKKGERAFLTYLDECIDLDEYVDLHHLTPWNIQDLSSYREYYRRSVVFILSDEKNYFYLSEEMKIKLIENEITTIHFPYNIPDEKLANSSYSTFLSGVIDEAKIFTKEQYGIVLRMIRMAIHCKNRIGNENILFNEIFLPLDLRENKIIRHNKKIIDSDEYFYITEAGFQKLRQIPPNQLYPVIIEVKQIDINKIKDFDEFEKIIEEGKLVVFNKGEKILIHNDVFQDRQRWQKIIQNSNFVIAIENEGKFAIYHPNINYEFIDENTYNYASKKILKCLEEKLYQKKCAYLIDQQHFINNETKAKMGNTEAQYLLGLAFENGKGIEQSLETAIYCYEFAAEQNWLGALQKMAKFYEEGMGVEKSLEKAFSYYKRAAEIDESGLAFLSLARCYKLGIGTEKSIEDAMYYYKLAGEYGHLYGYYALERCYEEMAAKEKLAP